MNKLFAIIILFGLLFFSNPAFAQVDKYSKEYLQNNKHFAIINPLVEFGVENAIKNSLKKETGANLKVKFEGYTTSSMKKGIFKYLEIWGNDVVVNGIELPYLNLKSKTDYNYIEYYKNPIIFKSDMEYAFNVHLTDNSINTALKDAEYNETINRINKLAYPMIEIVNVKTKIIKNKLHVVVDYTLPLLMTSKNKSFGLFCDLKVENGKIVPVNIKLENTSSKINIDKLGYLLNQLNPLDFTLKLLEDKNGQGKIENVNIIDNIIKINGTIYIKGE